MMKKATSLLLTAFAFMIFGSTLFLYQNCSKPVQDMGDVGGDSVDPKDCSLDGVIVQNGFPVTAYNTANVPAGQTCPAPITRMCQNGVFGGDASYRYSSCTPLDGGNSAFSALTLSIEVNGQTLPSNQAVPYASAYKIVISNVNGNQSLISSLVGCTYINALGQGQASDCVGNYKCLTSACNSSDNAGFVVEGNRLVQSRTNLDWNLPEYGMSLAMLIKPNLSAPDTSGSVITYIYQNSNPVGTSNSNMWYSSDPQGLNRIVYVSRSTGLHYNNWYNAFTSGSTSVAVCAEVYGSREQDMPGLSANCYAVLTHYKTSNGTYALIPGKQTCASTFANSNSNPATAPWFRVAESALGTPISTNYYINGGNSEASYVCPNMDKYYFFYNKGGVLNSVFPLTWTP